MEMVSKTIGRAAILVFNLAFLLLVVSAQSYGQDSQASAQDTTNYLFSHDIVEKTYTFEGVNPYSKVTGVVTITISGGVMRGNIIAEGRFAGGLRVSGEQRGTFSFVPYDSSQPSFTGKFDFKFAGDTGHGEPSNMAFLLECTGSDGSSQSFLQMQLASVNEYGPEISFGKLRRVVEDTPDDNP